jgi:hypothetical protein
MKNGQVSCVAKAIVCLVASGGIALDNRIKTHLRPDIISTY